jgi:seryl-tRNA synthetase
MNPADDVAGFRDDLVDAGILVPTGVAGLYGKSQTFLEIFDGVYSWVTAAGRTARPELFEFPPVMPREAFVRTDYLRSFPDLIGSIHSFTGGDADHGDLLRTVEQGGDWSSLLSATDVVMLPAACYPLYPMASGRLPIAGRLFDVLGTCFRHEPSSDPARMQVFHQREYVHLGTPASALDFRDHWLSRAPELMTDLGLTVRVEVANDPFFGRAGKMLAANQRSSALKYEIVATVANAEKPTAIVSCNCHQDHLTVPFGIETFDGAVAHSACVGFGMERIVLALLAVHGLDTSRWPVAVRGRLWP